MQTIDTETSALATRRLTSIPLADWEAISDAFRDAPSCDLHQAWLAAPSRNFRPARVRTAWTNDALAVYAELEDCDIFNPEARFNEMAFTRGDVFEIFLRPANQETYFEFHISPHNQKLQLRIPSASALRSCTFEQLKIHEPKIWSRADIQAESERWLVLALIPFDLVLESGKIAVGDQWRFSFSRYDYTRGHAKPTLSSTSPHHKCDFHRQHEWRVLSFEE